MPSNPSAYKVYVFHRSYFCGKMLAYLRYKGIPHNAVYQPLSEVGDLLMRHTGLRQMPVIETSDGQWLQDTTPMIEWFETKYPNASILPEHEVGAFFARLIEDYADEYLWRPAIYFRWQFPEDRALYKSLFVEEFLGGFWAKAKPLKWLAGNLVHKHQRDKFLQGDGITEHNRAHVEHVYTSTLNRMEKILQERPFIMGDRPSLADFGFFGSMFWHFSNDPTPNRIMQEQAPAVFEWVARMWNAQGKNFSSRDFHLNDEGIPIGCDELLQDICQNYLPYLAQNASEFEKGQRTFDWEVEGYTYPGVHVSPYRVWCRERLQQAFASLSSEGQQAVRDTLEAFEGFTPLIENGHITSNWDPEGIAPFCKGGKVPLKHKLTARFTGTNHVRTRRLWSS